mmetsp:Transcript_16593/g.62816  ORF Transcript_16593/g.62816 Transcript_16593/m.62816 type:complete len:245 (-) Transcript_16593:1554-2288(-)
MQTNQQRRICGTGAPAAATQRGQSGRRPRQGRRCPRGLHALDTRRRGAACGSEAEQARVGLRDRRDGGGTRPAAAAKARAQRTLSGEGTARARGLGRTGGRHPRRNTAQLTPRRRSAGRPRRPRTPQQQHPQGSVCPACCARSSEKPSRGWRCCCEGGRLPEIRPRQQQPAPRGPRQLRRRGPPSRPRRPQTPGWRERSRTWRRPPRRAPRSQLSGASGLGLPCGPGAWPGARPAGPRSCRSGR